MSAKGAEAGEWARAARAVLAAAALCVVVGAADRPAAQLLSQAELEARAQEGLFVITMLVVIEGQCDGVAIREAPFDEYRLIVAEAVERARLPQAALTAYPESPEFRGQLDAFLRERGVTSGANADHDAFCSVAESEIGSGSAIGLLLRNG